MNDADFLEANIELVESIIRYIERLEEISRDPKVYKVYDEKMLLYIASIVAGFKEIFMGFEKLSETKNNFIKLLEDLKAYKLRHLKPLDCFGGGV